MVFTSTETIIMILAIALATVITRSLPFVLFPEHKEVPAYVAYLGRVLPCAVIGLLVVYCFKGVTVAAAPYGLPELIASGIVVILHLWKRNTLLSIAGGTLIYMFLVQQVFI